MSLNLRVPVVLNKFLQGTQIAPPDFVAKWRALVGPPTKLQEVVCTPVISVLSILDDEAVMLGWRERRGAGLSSCSLCHRIVISKQTRRPYSFGIRC